MKLLATVVAALALSAPALADDLPKVMKDGTHTKTNFEETYKVIVNDGLKEGHHIETTCWETYCQKYLFASYKDGSFNAAFLLTYKNGEEVRQFCVASKEDGNNDRNCADSSGGFWREHYNGTDWKTTESYADHFENETAAAAASM